MMACQHRKCYRFEVMKLRESTVLIFNMLLKKFKTMPEVIIYDNACNLHSTCIMRYVLHPVFSNYYYCYIFE